MRMGLCTCVVFVLVMLLSFKLIVSHFDTTPCIEVFVALFLICTSKLKKFCELKGRNIGIVEKAQETRFGISPKYSR